MRVILLAAVALLNAGVASAQCVGTDSFYTCSDSSGNSYTVNRMGNTTMMNGYNSRTGSTWSQDSTTFGGTTLHSGRAANGNSWNMTEQTFGGTTFYNGTDSRGNSFSGACGIYGCD